MSPSLRSSPDNRHSGRDPESRAFLDPAFAGKTYFIFSQSGPRQHGLWVSIPRYRGRLISGTKSVQNDEMRGLRRLEIVSISLDRLEEGF
jgi:hypothetical protein